MIDSTFDYIIVVEVVINVQHIVLINQLFDSLYRFLSSE